MNVHCGHVVSGVGAIGSGPEPGAALGGVLQRRRSGASSHRLQARRMTVRTCVRVDPAACPFDTHARRHDGVTRPSYPTRYIGTTLLPAVSWSDASG